MKRGVGALNQEAVCRQFPLVGQVAGWYFRVAESLVTVTILMPCWLIATQMPVLLLLAFPRTDSVLPPRKLSN